MSRIDPRLEAVDGGLGAYVAARRWFRGKARTIARCSLDVAVPLPTEEGGGTAASAPVWMGIARVVYADGGAEDYALPLTVVGRERAPGLRAAPHLVVAELADGGAIVDALGEERALGSLLPLFAREAISREGGSELRFRRIAASIAEVGAEARPVVGEQSNTSIAYGQAYMLKVIRKLDLGISADLEMGEFLTRAGYPHAPAVVGAVELARDGREPGTVAILHHFVPNRGDAWAFFLARLASRLTLADPAADVLQEDRPLLQLLATRIAELHVTLGSRADVPAFAPEPITKEDRARLAAAAGASLRGVFASLASTTALLPPEAAPLVARLSGLASVFAARLADFAARDMVSRKTRIHGDLHLGQVLVSGDDFILIDFEGEPARPLAERRAKRSPLADVAGMLRSLHYAAMSAARVHPERRSEREGAMRRWYEGAREAFLDAYFEGVGGASFLPPRRGDAQALLDFYLLEKCVYEVHYELNNRPQWAVIPLAGLAQLVEGVDAS